jgi:hypothetical protein
MRIGDHVFKSSGDYHAYGVVVGFFNMFPEEQPPREKNNRVVVRHMADGGGYFCHIYKPENLEVLSEPPKYELVLTQVRVG